MTKINATNNGITGWPYAYTSFLCISDKNAYPGSNHEETIDKVKLSIILKKIVSVHFKNVKIMKQSVAEVVQMRHDN